MTNKFAVEVEGKATQSFDTADDALRFAMHFVWLRADLFQKHQATLNNGVAVSYSYGFSSVNIIPLNH